MKRILFITRRYPPIVGGIETFCYQLHENLSKKRSVKLIALKKKSTLHLAWFMPYALSKALYSIIFKKVDVVYLSDGVTASLAVVLKAFKRIRLVSTVYGLEMTYKNRMFRFLMNQGLNNCNKIGTISNETLSIMKAHIDESKIKLIYVGVKPPEISDDEIKSLKSQFETEYGIDFQKDRVLFNFGRMVPRKGMVQFLKKGFPLLDKNAKLIIGGDGPDYERIRETSQQDDLQGRVIVLKRPSDEIIAMLRNSAHLFIMPNVKYPNDLEGYGMAQLESMYSGMPVVAFAVDALTESVRIGGYLIEPENYHEFTATIQNFFELSQTERKIKQEEASNYVKSEYSWENTCDEYIELFEN